MSLAAGGGDSVREWGENETRQELGAILDNREDWGVWIIYGFRG